jgi:UDP-N-acetylmuramoylalanine-D-glutamate ligase
MTPQEKAKELVEKYWNLPTQFHYVIDGVVFVNDSHINYKTAKQCALIAVDEIIISDWFIPTKEYLNAWKNYWEQVKNEIKKL